MTELRLDGKVALITGSGRGLGRAYAHLFAARGAKIVVNDPGVTLEGAGGDVGPAQSVVDEISRGGGMAVANYDTVASEAGARAMIAQALGSFGRIDIIINNAGNFLPKRPFDQTSIGSFDSIWQVHFMGSVNVIRAAWPHLTAQRSGRIVNTASHVGYLGSRGKLEYSAAKGAIHGLTRSLAFEAATYGIAVNAIAPGGMTRPNMADAGIAAKFSNGAFEPDLVAPTVLWLAHEQCRVNGEIFSAMAGSTTRIKVAETMGYFNAAPTPELVRDNFNLIMGQDALAAANLSFGTEAEARGMELVGLHAAG